MKYFKLFVPPIIYILLKKLRIYPNTKKNSIVFPDNKLINSFSQYYEDLIVDAILNKSKGFYVDVGANDPDHLSNTKRFYEKGWSGINIEPQSHKVKEFNLFRERDINLNTGIGNTNGFLEFFELEISTLSSFNKKVAIENCEKYNTKIKAVRSVPINRLDTIFQEYLPDGTTIDFLSIDTEGFELQVLESNNWELFRPTIIIIEFGDKIREIHSLLESFNYRLVFKNSCNLIYINNE